MSSEKFWEDIDIACELGEFFWQQKERIQEDYETKKIGRRERNKLMKLLRESRNATMRENDPFTKNNQLLREIAERFRKFRNIP